MSLSIWSKISCNRRIHCRRKRLPCTILFEVLFNFTTRWIISLFHTERLLLLLLSSICRDPLVVRSVHWIVRSLVNSSLVVVGFSSTLSFSFSLSLSFLSLSPFWQSRRRQTQAINWTFFSWNWTGPFNHSNSFSSLFKMLMY